MVITYYGHSCFKIKGQNTSILIDPFKPDFVGVDLPKFDDIDVLAITHAHGDHSNKEAVVGNPFVIEGPGEYDVKDVYVEGINTFHDNEGGSKRGLNTVYKITLEDVTLCHLGDLGHILTTEQIESIGAVNVLFCPVGGNYTIDANDALKVINQIQPSIIVPMHYKNQGSKVEIDTLDKFLQVYGHTEEVKTVKSLKVNTADFADEEKQPELVILAKS